MIREESMASHMVRIPNFKELQDLPVELEDYMISIWNINLSTEVRRRQRLMESAKIHGLKAKRFEAIDRLNHPWTACEERMFQGADFNWQE